MRHDTPLRAIHQDYVEQVAADRQPPREADRPGAASGQVTVAKVDYLPYQNQELGEQEQICEIPASFGEVEAEYASFRRAAGLLDLPQRATLRITGADRVAFLNNMLTQQLKSFASGMVRESFWLNRKGRIEGDLLLIETGEAILIDVDIHAADQVVKTLDSYVMMDDVQIANATESMYRLAVHGPKALDVINVIEPGPVIELEPLTSRTVTIAGHSVVIARRDQIGQDGLELFLPREAVENVWNALLQTDAEISESRRRIRPCGWYAYNIARIEAGTPLFNVDFSSHNLPHETSLVNARVSFTKGCFLGQEIVARMQNLGRPKQMLMGLRIDDDVLPLAGSLVHASEGESAEAIGDQIGTVTSSTLSPMLGATSIAFAMLNTRSAEPNVKVIVEGDGRRAFAQVQESLQFWSA